MSQFAWTADAVGWIYWYNKRWYDYTGTTLEEMQGWGWQKVHHPEHLDRVVKVIRQCFESGTPWEDTFPLRGRDGAYRWFLSRALPIRNETGDVVRWFGTNTDITKQIEAETALRALNETLEQRVEEEAEERAQIWNVSQDLLLVADMSGKFLSVNPAWTATLGWSESDLVGKTSAWLLHPDDQAKAQVEQTRLAEGGTTRHFESRLRHARGSYCWLSWRAVGDKGRIYAVGRDVTELKIAEVELRTLRRELATVSRQTAMGVMTASIAHEMNQPLGSIVTNANASLRWLARAEPDLDEARANLMRIVNDGHRASQVIASIRSMFGKDRGEQSAVSLNDIVSDVLALVRGELENRKVSVRNEMLPELPQVMAERVQLQQVFLNLITNAIDAMSAVTNRERVLTVRSEVCESDHVLITVEDTGTGIAQDRLERIFNSFYTTKADGMGMGLSICRSIIEAHGGLLWASTRSPHGSSFYIKLAALGPDAE
jgi:PAS domain S-box-containing protein